MTVHITYFVHGTTTDNEKDLATGWLPGELSQKGKDETKRLAEQLAGKHFDVVFCSDLQRAVDSANLCFGGKCEIIHDQRLRECNYGDLNGTAASAFKDKLTDYIDVRFPEGESYHDVTMRLSSFVDFLRENYDGKRIAVVAHQAPQLALDVLLRGKSWHQAIAEDWRKTKAWQPGWEYVTKEE
ncbi:MAG TPA: histidine phosphatase family protein [Patescibacteria group bacterium]|nr:histidine phosphatase family protein [Patescibacteria group bacterium]